MDATAMIETIGQVKANVDEIKKQALPRGEADERFKKIEGDLTSALDALRKMPEQKHSTPIGDTDGAGAWLARKGFQHMGQIPQGASLYKTNHAGQTFDDNSAPECVQEAFKAMDHLHIADTLMSLTRGPGRGKEWERAKDEKGFDAFLEKFPTVAGPHLSVMKDFLAYHGKTLTSTTATTGDEWVPTLWGTNLMDEIRLANPEVNLIRHVNQPSNPWRNPILSGVGKAYRKIENANAASSDLTTGNRDWEAHANSVYQAFSDEMSEDSIVAVLPTVRGAIIRAMAEGVGMTIVNGDNDDTGHFDNDYQYASGNWETYQGGMNGLRQFGLDAQGSGSASLHNGGGDFLSYQDIGDAAALMGKFGAGRVALGEVVALVNAESWMKLLTESGSPLVTLDKYGSRATIISGELGRIFGIPIMVSYAIEQRRNSVTAAEGQNISGGTNTFSTAVLFNRTNFVIGDRRDFRLEQDRDIIAGRTDLVGTNRLSMNAIEGDVSDANWDPSGTPAVVCIRNID